MSKVKLLTQSEYAKHRGCSAVAVHKAVKAGRISLIDGRIDPDVADIQWERNTRARVSAQPPAALEPVRPPEGLRSDSPADETRSGDYGYWQSRSRREAAEASMAEMKRAELAGELIRVSAVRAALTQAYVTMREAILNIPARVAPQLAAESDPATIQNLLHAEVHSALTALSTVSPPPASAAAPGSLAAE